MNLYPQQLSEAANWIWSHRDEPEFWTYLVLTDKNPAPDSLKYPQTIAFNIFTILEQRKLILPDLFTIEQNGKLYRISAHKLNLDKHDEWRQLMYRPSTCRKIWSWFIRSTSTFTGWMLGLIIAGIIGAVIHKYVRG